MVLKKRSIIVFFLLRQYEIYDKNKKNKKEKKAAI